MSPGRSSGEGWTSMILPVISRHRAVVSSSERLHRGPHRRSPSRRPSAAGSPAARPPGRAGHPRAADREPACRYPQSRCMLERPSEVVGKQPVGEHSLIDLAHLPGPGDQPRSGRSPRCSPYVAAYSSIRSSPRASWRRTACALPPWERTPRSPGRRSGTRCSSSAPAAYQPRYNRDPRSAATG